MNSRGLLIACTALVAVASPAFASGKLKLKGIVAAPPPVDQTITLRQTDNQFVSLKTWLDTIPAENDISCTVTGAVPMKVWPFQDAAYTQSSGSRTWVKRELYPFYERTPNTAAATSGASVGTGVGEWQCSALDGADQSGSLSTHRVVFDVTSDPITTQDIGALSRAGYGGFALSNLPGSPANKTITLQSTANTLAIFTQSNSIAFNGTYGSATLTVGTPTIGDGAYWADVTDNVLGQTWRVYFNVIANRSSVTVATGDTINSGQFNTVIANYLCAGQEVVLEPGTYGGWGTFVSNTPPSACASTPGITVPTAPYADGYRPDGDLTYPATPNAGIKTLAPGWINVFCRTPLACIIPPSTMTVNRAGYAFYLRIGNIVGAPEPRVFTSTNGVHWLMFDHGTWVGSGGTSLAWNFTRDYATNLFSVDNYIDGGATTNVGTMVVNGRDSQIVGNSLTNILGDRVLFFTYNSSVGVDRSDVSWNVHKNLPTACDAHIDNFQTNMSATNTIYRGLPAGTEVEWADMIGNTMWRGAGDYYQVAGPDFGKACAGASEEVYIGNHGSVYTRSDINHRLKFVANFSNDLSSWGFDLMTLTSTSILANNMNTWGYEVTYDFINGLPPNNLGAASNTSTVAFQPVDALSQSGIQVYRNIRINSTASTIWSLGNTANPLPSPVLSDNWAPGYDTGATGLANMQTQFVDPTIGEQAQTIADMMGAFQGQPGSIPMSFTKPAGPFTTLIDQRRRVYSPDILTP